MKKLFAGWWLAGAVVLSLPALAEVDERTAVKVMHETVFWDALGGVARELRDVALVQISSPREQASSGVVNSVRVIAEAAFSEELGQDFALAAMRKGLDDAAVAEVRNWDATPLGQKLLAVEKRNAANLYRSSKRMTNGGVEPGSLDDLRRKALVDIIDATKVVEGNAAILGGGVVVAYRAIAAANPKATDLPSEEQLIRMVEADLASAPILNNLLITNYATTYADFSTEELVQYVAYLRSPAGVKFNETALAGVHAVIKGGTDEFTRQLRNARNPIDRQ